MFLQASFQIPCSYLCCVGLLYIIIHVRYIRMQLTYCFYRFGYDGQEDLLFNLDNINLVYYDLLLDYLHLMVEEQSPFIAYLQASQRSNTSQSLPQRGRLAVLQRTWNAFLRLHDKEFTNSFQCLICAQNLDVVVSDGTMLGFRKDFLAVSHQDCQQEDMPLLLGQST